MRSCWKNSIKKRHNNNVVHLYHFDYNLHPILTRRMGEANPRGPSLVSLSPPVGSTPLNGLNLSGWNELDATHSEAIIKAIRHTEHISIPELQELTVKHFQNKNNSIIVHVEKTN
jgi:hypothetical protein